jgi:hypothetical protein
LRGISIEKVGIRGLLLETFGYLRRSKKGAAIASIFKQLLCFFYDGTSRHISYFDHLKKDAGYAAVMESSAGEMVSSHQVKRFFQGVHVALRGYVSEDSEADVHMAVTDREA